MDLIVFDLDGTLVDSRRDIAASVNELLGLRGRQPLPLAQVVDYIGEGVANLLARSFGESATDKLPGLVSDYLAIYRRRLLDTTLPYPGVREALPTLASGRVLSVLTNKPRPESVRILDGLGLSRYFGSVLGGEDLPRRKPDPIGIRTLMESVGTEPQRTLMVGDSRIDFETGRNAGVAVCLVTYGLGGRGVAALEPDLLVDDLMELVQWLVG
jgi:phosphoglycolate phosphatase